MLLREWPRFVDQRSMRPARFSLPIDPALADWFPTPGRDAGCTALLGDFGYPQPRYLDLRAAVHHHLEAGGLGAGGGFFVDHADLEPDRFGPGRDRLVDRLAGGKRAAEDVVHVDLLADLAELAPDIFAMDM